MEKKIISDEYPESKYLVVGPPRGGFTLLLSILNIFCREKGSRKSEVQQIINHFIPLAGDFVDKSMENYFHKHIDLNDLCFSPEFRLLMGGPKWIDEEDINTACIRKYFGVRGMGDFTFIQYLPKEVLGFDEVVHSHSNPKKWTEDSYYDDYMKLTSIRNPMDIIHSSVYSLNALTSDYVQKFVKEDEKKIRYELGMNKLSDPTFVEGLVIFLSKYFEEFIRVKDRYLYIMKWEDLIAEPEKIILEVADSVGIKISNSFAKELWREIDHRNLTRWHMHSFRKGVLDDWKNSITNTHLEIFKKYNFDFFVEELGYDRIKFFDEKDYTPTQKLIEDYIKRGEVYKPYDDENLYTFSFNKTNFVATKYRGMVFKSYPKLGSVRIERSTFKNQEMLEGFRGVIGDSVQMAGEFIEQVKLVASLDDANIQAGFETLRKDYLSKFELEFSEKDLEKYENYFSGLAELFQELRKPILVKTVDSFNIVYMNRKYLLVPHSLGHIDLGDVDVEGIPSISIFSTLVEAISSAREL